MKNLQDLIFEKFITCEKIKLKKTADKFRGNRHAKAKRQAGALRAYGRKRKMAISSSRYGLRKRQGSQ